MKHSLGLLVGAALLAGSGAASALSFNFTFVPGTSAPVQQAFVDAGARWSALLADPVTLDLTVGQGVWDASLGPTLTHVRPVSYAYTSFKAALTADAGSGADALALASLPVGNSFSVVINRTLDSPFGAGSAGLYLDAAGANNTTITLSAANAKALGLAVAAGTIGGCIGHCDASILLGKSYTWDFNPGDGIAAGSHDFVGIATHEIGHALGFNSGVDRLDEGAYFGLREADYYTFVSALDLFRYSTQFVAPEVIDWSVSARPKYFSLDKGETFGPEFSTGKYFGDGQQASHWKDGLAIGIMDPTADAGEVLYITGDDTLALDVIGWNLVATVPEPSTYALFGLGLLAITRCRHRVRAG